MAGSSSAAPLVIQNQVSPDVVVNGPLFYAHTRRQRFPMYPKTKTNWSGGADSMQLRQTGICAGLEVRVSGNVNITGTIGTTTPSYNWPHLVKQFKVSANGQSNLYNARSVLARALEFTQNTDLNDRGLVKTFATVSQSQGTLALSCDDWGTNGVNGIWPATNVVATASYSYDMTYFLPLAADQVSLIAAVFLQSQQTNITLDVAYFSQAELFTAFGGSAVLDMSQLNIKVTGLVYSIPQVDGKFIIPDLTQFHGVVENFRMDLGQGVNEPQFAGAGVGRKLLRALFQVNSSSAPLAVTDANYTTLGWAYGGNTVPELVATGGELRAINERQVGCDVGKNWGFGLWDFAGQYALRDLVDLGQAPNARLQIGLVSAPTNCQAYITQETLFSGVSA